MISPLRLRKVKEIFFISIRSLSSTPFGFAFIADIFKYEKIFLSKNLDSISHGAKTSTKK